MSGSHLDKDSLNILREAAEILERGFPSLPPSGHASVEHIPAILNETALRLQDNFPYFHPLYAGQMLKPPHPVARLAYMLSLWINPNNHALDGGRASSVMEQEAVAELARMVGWKSHLGHLTGGGTMANLEALWVCGKENPGKTVVASDQAHYTHQRISAVLGIPFETVGSDLLGRMRMDRLKERLQRGDVGAVVGTLGTTALGAVDPLNDIVSLCRETSVRLHVDAAYGGYYKLSSALSAEARRAFDCIDQADSIVIDPHKHGLQPYGCGCVLFRDPSIGRWYRHDSPYTYFSSDELHLGEISLECSRAGASAVALWATQRLLPLVPGGAFAQSIDRCRRAALMLHQRIAADPRLLAGPVPDLDIVVWGIRAPRVSEASSLARKVFEEAARRNLHLALADLPLHIFPLPSGTVRDRDALTCLRSVLMKPEHEEWIERIGGILGEAVTTATGNPL